ncbi:hypothetical protein GCM10028814_14610 [Angustibacter aerolatus]
MRPFTAVRRPRPSRSRRGITGALAAVAVGAAVCAAAPQAATAATADVAAASARSASHPTGPLGVDASRWQSPGSTTGACGSIVPDWRRVRDTHRFLVHRAAVTLADGTNSVDPCYRAAAVAARAAGLYRGAYMYVRPSTTAGSAAASARFLVAATGRLQEPGDLPPVLDLEVSGGLTPAQLQAWVRTWLTTVQRLTNRTPVVYTTPSFWRGAMADSTAFHAYPLWIAHWGPRTPSVPGGWPTWTLWQYSATGSVAGIRTDVDLDAFNGDAAGLRAFAHPSTTISTTTTGARAFRGSTWTLRGRLTTTGPSSAAAGRAVKLLVRAKGSSAAWRQVATTTTSAGGAFAFVRRPSSAWEYKVRFSGSRAVAASWSTERAHTISDRYAAEVTATTSATRVARGHAVTVRGSLRRTASKLPLTGKSLRVYTKRTAKGSKWVLAKSVRTSAVRGTYRATLHPTTSVSVKVVFAGSTANRPDTSPVHRLSVR